MVPSAHHGRDFFKASSVVSPVKLIYSYSTRNTQIKKKRPPTLESPNKSKKKYTKRILTEGLVIHLKKMAKFDKKRQNFAKICI